MSDEPPRVEPRGQLDTNLGTGTEESLEAWLARLRTNPPEPELTPRTSEPPAPITEVPPFAFEPDAPRDQANEPPAEGAREELPPWMQGYTAPTAFLDGEPTGEATETTPEPGAPSETHEELPPWMKGYTAPTAFLDGDSTDDTTEASSQDTANVSKRVRPPGMDAELPDWLSDLGDGSFVEGTSDELPVSPEVVDETPARASATEDLFAQEQANTESQSVEPDAELPDWLKQVQGAKAQTGDKLDEAEWVSKVGKTIDEELINPESDALATSLADWLREAPTATPETDLATPPELLETGEIPSWVQALRPAEATPTIVPLPQEAPPTTGYLAGLRGILPLAPMSALPKVGEPPAPPSPETVSGANASTFASILATPAELAEGVYEEHASRRALPFVTRLLINLLLLLVVVVGLVLPLGLTGDLAQTLGAQITGTPTEEFSTLTRNLQPGSTIVMAFDYDAGQAGELDPGARALLNDVLSRNIRVIALSTTTTGATLAQDIFEQLAGDNSTFVYGTNFLNLSYVPGEGTGLRGLADKGFASLTRDFQGTRRETFTSFGAIRGFQDVALTVVIAGDETHLKMWIEQVYAARPLPLAALVSAQIEPQARTYRNAKQLQAFMRGLSGAAEYELLSNQSGRALAEVNAQSFAHLALVFLILAGNLASVMRRGKR